MSDLISKSELLKKIEKYKFSAISNDAEREFIRNTIIKTVQEQTAAYDIDKVVEELESDERHTFDGCINKRYAIEIVKQGGVSDDVCEKMQMQAYNKAVDNCLKILYFHQNEYDGIQWAIREIEELKEMESD